MMPRDWKHYPVGRRKPRSRMEIFLKPFTGRDCLAITALIIAILLTLILLTSARAGALPQYVVTACDTVNVRTEARLDAEDIGDLYGGDVVAGRTYQDGWVLVDAPVEAGEGWVYAEYLTLKDMPTGCYTNASDGRVRIRREPDGKPRGWIKTGGTVDVQRWVAVEGVAWAVTNKGYVDGSWLEASK